MTPITFDRRSLKLTAAEWQALEAIAAKTASLAPTGKTAKRPSWRTLIKRLADGELEIIRTPQDAPQGT